MDMTRDLIANEVHGLEDQGLHALEDGACAAFTGPAAPFCSWAFNSPFGQYVNNEIEQVSRGRMSFVPGVPVSFLCPKSRRRGSLV